MYSVFNLKYRVLLAVIVCFTVNSFGQRPHLDRLSKETKAYLNQAKECWEFTDESCIPFYKQFVASAKRKKECLACAQIELARGYFFEDVRDSCMLVLDEVLKNAKKEKDSLRWYIELDVYNLKGSIYNETGRHEKAIASYLDCRKRIEKLGLVEQGALLNVNLGLLYLNMGDNDRAVTLLKSAARTLEREGISRQTALIYRNLALAYNARGDMDSMFQILPKTLQLAKEQNSVNTEIAVYSYYAQYYELINSDSVLYYADKAISLAREFNREREMVGALFSKAMALNNGGNYKDAKPLYLEAIKYYEETKSMSILTRIYHSLGTAAYQNNDAEIAAKYLYLHDQLNDSIANAERQKNVYELGIKYETEKKERQIAEQQLTIKKEENQKQLVIFIAVILGLAGGAVFIILRKNHRSKLRSIQQEKENLVLNAFIQGEERERNRISHELHDGVAATIGAVKMGMESLPLLSKEVQDTQIKKLIRILEHTHADVRHMAHNLLPTQLEQEGLLSATTEFANEINETQLITLTVVDINSEVNNLPKQLQLMLFRIIQELINNIIKHSQADRATISFTKGDGKLQIIVSDNGIGIQNKAGTKSQGLYSIQQRLKSIGGNFKIINETNEKGTKAIAELDVS